MTVSKKPKPKPQKQIDGFINPKIKEFLDSLHVESVTFSAGSGHTNYIKLKTENEEILNFISDYNNKHVKNKTWGYEYYRCHVLDVTLTDLKVNTYFEGYIDKYFNGNNFNSIKQYQKSQGKLFYAYVKITRDRLLSEINELGTSIISVDAKEKIKYHIKDLIDLYTSKSFIKYDQKAVYIAVEKALKEVKIESLLE